MLKYLLHTISSLLVGMILVTFALNLHTFLAIIELRRTEGSHSINMLRII